MGGTGHVLLQHFWTWRNKVLPARPSPLRASEAIIAENMEPTYAKYLKDLFDKMNTVQQRTREHLIESKLKSKEYYDRRINPQNFKPGDLVYLLKEPNRGKFTDQYTGPYKVLDISKNQNVTIEVRGARDPYI
jgi:hypothetical protein